MGAGVLFVCLLQNSALCEYDLITGFFCSLQLPFYLPLWPKVDLLFYWRGWYFVEIRKISLKFELNYPTQLSRMHGLVRKITPILPTRANPTLLPPPAKPPKIVSSWQLFSNPCKTAKKWLISSLQEVWPSSRWLSLAATIWSLSFWRSNKKAGESSQSDWKVDFIYKT